MYLSPGITRQLAELEAWQLGFCLLWRFPQFWCAALFFFGWPA
jgi:hypothetical protein